MTTQIHRAAPKPVPAIGLHRIVAENVRVELARQMMSQTALGEILGLKQQLVSDRLRAKTPFTLDEIGIIANVLGVSITELVTAHKKAPHPDNPGEGTTVGITGGYPQVRPVSHLRVA